MPAEASDANQPAAEGVSSVTREGFSLAIDGLQHVMISKGRAQVIMKRKTRYKIEFTNTRLERAMVCLAINGSSIGRSQVIQQ